VIDSGEDRWPLPKYPAVAKEFLHALGVISLNFNNFEFGLFRLFSHHFEMRGFGIKVPWKIYRELQDAKKAPAIRSVFAEYEKDAAVIDHVNHVLEYFFVARTIGTI
jgi:hypothetical protein